MSRDEFPTTFDELQRILSPFEDQLVLKQDTAEEYSLDTPCREKWDREIFFGS